MKRAGGLFLGLCAFSFGMLLLLVVGCETNSTSQGVAPKPNLHSLFAELVLCGVEACGAGEICDGEQCVLVCDWDDDCPLTDRCAQNGYCSPIVPVGETVMCIENNDCDSRLCDSGSCVPARDCINSAQCFNDEICSLSGFCVLACVQNDDCPGSERCVNGGCIDSVACSEGSECPSGQCFNSVCIRTCDDSPAADEVDGYCGHDTACHDGWCQPRCSFDIDCETGQCVFGTCVDDFY